MLALKAIPIVMVALALASCGVGAGRSTDGEDRSASAPGKVEVILATTTSTYDTGLLDILVPRFQEQTGYVVKPIAVGTGQAFAMARQGEADVLLTHDPTGERALVDEGVAAGRHIVMHNFFVLVGPPEDPANVRGGQDAVTALERVAAAEALFMSRGDDSGTHRLEQRLWSQAGREPGGRWYQETGQGMGATLVVTTDKGGYTLTDRGTYLALRENLALEPMVQGDPRLLNVYSVLPMNAARSAVVHDEGAQAWAEFMLSEETQRFIGQFGVDRFGEPLFAPGPPGGEEGP